MMLLDFITEMHEVKRNNGREMFIKNNLKEQKKRNNRNLNKHSTNAMVYGSIKILCGIPIVI